MKCRVIYKPYRKLGAQKPSHPCHQHSLDEWACSVLTGECALHFGSHALESVVSGPNLCVPALLVTVTAPLTTV